MEMETDIGVRGPCTIFNILLKSEHQCYFTEIIYNFTLKYFNNCDLLQLFIPYTESPVETEEEEEW